MITLARRQLASLFAHLTLAVHLCSLKIIIFAKPSRISSLNKEFNAVVEIMYTRFANEISLYYDEKGKVFFRTIVLFIW